MPLIPYWYKVCSKLNRGFERFYYMVGYHVSKRPYLAIASGILISFLFGLGFLRFHEIDRVEKLYIPQRSQAMKDLARGSDHYLLKARPEEFILKYRDDKSVIEPEIFKRALDIHYSITNLDGLDDICIKLIGGKCFTQSPLKFFNYTKAQMDHVKRILTAYVNSNNSRLYGRSWQMLFPTILGDFEIDTHTGSISAKSIRVQYYLKYPESEKMYQEAQQWELQYLSEMEKWKQILAGDDIILYFTSGRSANDDVLRSAKSDTKLAAVSFMLMIIFCAATLANFHDPINGHFLLGLGGVLTLLIGIGGSFGLVLLCGNPFIGFTGVLPFLVLGIGIDNMFIITNCLDQHRDSEGDRFEKIAKTMSRVGTSITMTTVTDLVAFGVSTVTDFPAIKYFSIYVAASISYCYIMVLTLFLGLISLDVKRIEEKRLDGLPCIITIPKRQEEYKKRAEPLSRKAMRIYGHYLMKLPAKLTVVIFTLVLVTASVFGMLKTDQSFDPYAYGLKDSAFTEFSHYRDRAYPNNFEISVICDEPQNYTDPKVQMEYVKLDSIATSNGYVRKQTINWMTEYAKFAKQNHFGIEGKDFYENINMFLLYNQQFYADIKFNKKREITVSRMIMFGGDERESLYLRDEMVSLREDLRKKSKLPVYAVSQSFIFTEQFVIILGDTIRNIAITSTAIFFITIPYLVDPRIGMLVFCSFVSIIIELLAFMYLWNISLNSLSMIIIVMAIGFTVDYSAHIAHAFNISNAETTEQRVIEALETMGSSVMMGGFSTFVGICVTGFANSGIFRVFFKMVFGMVVLGLIHGLVILPVMLAIFCRVPKSSKSSQGDTDDSKYEIGQGEEEGSKYRYTRPSCSYDVEMCNGIDLTNINTLEVKEQDEAYVNPVLDDENQNKETQKCEDNSDHDECCHIEENEANGDRDNIEVKEHEEAYVNHVLDNDSTNNEHNRECEEGAASDSGHENEKEKIEADKSEIVQEQYESETENKVECCRNTNTEQDVNNENDDSLCRNEISAEVVCEVNSVNKLPSHNDKFHNKEDDTDDITPVSV